MRSVVVRILLVVVALAALAGAGYMAWTLEQQIRSATAASAVFEADAHQATLALAAIGSGQRAYVAEGQNSDQWQAKVAGQMAALGPTLTGLRQVAKSAEIQGALEAAIETVSAVRQADAKAREYIKAGQRLSASDVIFADANDRLAKAISSIEDARGRERTRQEDAAANIRLTQLLYGSGGLGVVVLVMLMLVPVRRRQLDQEHTHRSRSHSSSLGLSEIVPDEPNPEAAKPELHPADWRLAVSAEAPRSPDLKTTADICAALARVQDPRDLPGLLERAAKVLNATGLIVWMPEEPRGHLRPVLAHGYAPLALTRMGTIAPNADNVTAHAFRSGKTQILEGDALSNGAIAAPLVTAEGCTGVMAIELNGVLAVSGTVHAVATILAAQLATLITPASSPDAPPPRV